MADVHDKQTRSYNMRQIKSQDTKPELLVRKFLFANGFRYKLHDKQLSGKPDIVLPRLKSVIFVHGCFWHGHDNCKYFVVPKTRTEWWLQKIERNKQLNMETLLRLKNKDWTVLSVFECGLKSSKKERTLTKILKHLNNILNAQAN